MPSGERPFQKIEMDFVGQLPESEAFNTILVVTDQFTNVQDYIPAKTTWTAEDIADSYMNYIRRLCGLSRHLTLYCSLQFASKFRKELNQKLNINLCLSTAYHPQTDGLYAHAVLTFK